MNKNDHHGKIAFVILAAGESKRMGEIKQLLQWRHKSLISHIIDKGLDSRASEVFVVLGGNADKIAGAISDKPVGIIYNDKWKNGLGTSISAATKHLEMMEESWSGILFSLVDQPLITTLHFNHLIQLFTSRDYGIVATSNIQGFGVPAIFASTFFNDLVQLDGSKGARSIIHSNRHDTALIPFNESFIDLDTQDDYLKFLEQNS